MHDLAQVFWRIPLDPLLVVFIAFFCFIIAGPIAGVISIVLAVRRRTRRLGLLMLVSGVVGYFGIAAAVILRTKVYARFPSHNQSSDWLVSSLICGLAGFTAFDRANVFLSFPEGPN